MNSIEFSKNIPPETMAYIFKDWFEQHMGVYYMLKGVDFVSINNVDANKASIMYSVKVLDNVQKDSLLQQLQQRSACINIYGKVIIPEIFINGDLLCITIKKEET